MARQYQSPNRDILIRAKTKVLKLYADGWPCSSIAELFQVGDETVRQYLKSESIPLRRQGPPKRLAINEDAFDVLSEERDYWLGFIMADGNVWTSELSLCSHIDDIHHIDNFRTFVGAIDNTIKIRGKTATLKVNSIELVNKIKKHGIVPAKSLIAEAPHNLAMSNNFWRGVIDGDGCLTFGRRGYPHLFLTGSHKLLAQYAHYMETSIDFRPRVFEIGNVSRADLGGRKACVAANHLYADATVCLARKLERVGKFNQWWQSAKNAPDNLAQVLRFPPPGVTASECH